MSHTLELAKQLLACPSITPQDAGCQKILAERLKPLGFTMERLAFGEVENLWARRGKDEPLFVFLGHTDVVPTGPLEHWESPPFTPTVRNQHLYARGAADMKGNIAAMITACESFLKKHPHHRGSIAFLITSDEEGPSVDGTAKVIEHLEKRHEKITWCVVGEPSSQDRLGDCIKNGRRGSLSAHVIFQGKQGHVAYPQLADNPIHRSFAALLKLTQTVWDKGNAHFPPTTLQISNIHGGTGALNVIPGEFTCDFNFRYSTETTAEQLQKRVETLFHEHGLTYRITWNHSAKPFFTAPGELSKACEEAIHEITNLHTRLATDGGTSDGRFVAPTGSQVIELGVCNKTIHQINECVLVEDLDRLANIYERVLEKLLT